jgi:hypothetical protein
MPPAHIYEPTSDHCLQVWFTGTRQLQNLLNHLVYFNPLKTELNPIYHLLALL